jgi:hypothetical protein
LELERRLITTPNKPAANTGRQRDPVARLNAPTLHFEIQPTFDPPPILELVQESAPKGDNSEGESFLNSGYQNDARLRKHSISTNLLK